MSDAERYRLAWLSARQGRASFRRAFEIAQDNYLTLNGEHISRAYHDIVVRAYRGTLDQTEALLEDRDRELADLRLAFSELQGQQAQKETMNSEKKAEYLRQVGDIELEIITLRHKQSQVAQQAIAAGATYAALGDAVNITRQAARRRWPKAGQLPSTGA